MSEIEDNMQQSQNFAEVQFVTRDGSQIMEPLKVFQAVGAEYQIATPVLNGYVLVDRPAELVRTMTTEPAYIKLVYAQIGTLQVYHGLTDVMGEAIPLQNGQTADNVAPIRLQSIPGHTYYVMNDDGLGEPISNESQYQPADPAGKTNLISITEDERQHMVELEQNMTIEANEGSISQPQTTQVAQPQPAPVQPQPQPVPAQPQPAPVQPQTAQVAQPQPAPAQPQPAQPQPQPQPSPVAAQPAQSLTPESTPAQPQPAPIQPAPIQPSIQQTAATQPQPAQIVQQPQPQPAATQPAQPQPAATQPTQPAQPQSAVVQPQPVQVQAQPAPQPAQPEPSVQPESQPVNVNGGNPEVGSRQAQWATENALSATSVPNRAHTGAVDVISEALLMVSKALEETTPQDKQTRRELIESATRLVKAIGTLTRIDN